MDFNGKNEGKERYVCPSDRQLALRAKLQTGWSMGKSTGPLDADEKDAIIAVIRRNEQLESAERQRVGRLVERVEKIKERAAECGPKYCRLCGQGFGLLGPSKLICDDCRKPVCSKCSIELHSKSPTGTREIWLCKICSETREMWKKTGAWFFKGIPKYEIPPAKNTLTRVASVQETKKTRPEKVTKLGMRVDSSSSEDDDELTSKSLDYCNGYRPHNYRFGSDLIQKSLGSDDLFTSYKKSPISVFKRQSSTTSMECPKNGTASAEWDASSITGSAITRTSLQHTNSLNRRGSVSSSWSMSETSSGNSSNIVIPTDSSNLGHSNICREPPLGWLELSVLYSEDEHTLDCTILRARDLPAMDSAGLADPFCKLNIITEWGTVKQKKWLAVKTVHKTRSPEFNETVRFLGVEPEELGPSQLYVVVLDDDKYGHDFLGAAKIALASLLNSGASRMSVPLGAEDQHSIEAGTSGPWPCGQIFLSLCYNTKKRSLVVSIKRCVNLASKDSNGYSDPFIKLQLKPDLHRQKKYKTSIKWRNLNPIFNEEFAFEARPNDLDKQSLILTVWDKDIGKSNDFLGSLILGPNSKGRRLKQWKDCIRLPDYFHEQWHCLSNDQNTN